MTNERAKRVTRANTNKGGTSKAPTAKDKGKGKVTGEGSRKPTKRAQAETAQSKKKLHIQEEPPAPTSEEFERGTVEYTGRQITDYKKLREITFVPTRFISNSFLTKTGLAEDVKKIIACMGLTKFSETRDFVHPELAREFFATVELKYKKKTPAPDEGVLSFVCWGRQYNLTITELCEIYGFPNGTKTKFSDFSEAHSFWDTIAEGNASGNPKATLIRNPALRFVHKFLANTFFARKQSGAVRKEELCLLFKGVRRYMVDEDGAMFNDVEDDDVNLGCLFAKELTRVRAWGRNTQERQCLMGGLLTAIFRWVGMDLASIYQDPGRSFLDREYFIFCKFLEDTADLESFRYMYSTRQRESRSIPLPNPRLTTIDDIQNIYFEHPGEPLTVLGPRRKRDNQGETHVGSAEAPEIPIDEQQQEPDPWELPELKIKPTTAREKLLYNAYKVQQRINKMAKKKFDWIKSKLRKVPGYVSDEEEYEHGEETATGIQEDEEDTPIGDEAGYGPETSFQPAFDQGGSSHP